MAINSSVRKGTGLDALAGAIGNRLDSGASVPLLALRLPDLDDVASRHGARAARALERRTLAALQSVSAGALRSGDTLAHRTGSDRFAIAMLEPPRDGTAPSPAQVGAALHRISGQVECATGRRVVGGWIPLHRRCEKVRIAAAIDAALERTVRERERRELLATLGHELRGPLGSIRGYLETLADGGIDATIANRFLQTARREALRLGRMLDGMLEFSLLDLSAPPCNERTDASAAIEDAVAVATAKAQCRRVSLRTKCASNVALRVGADAVGHALRNLIDNAVEWTPPGGEVRITALQRDGFVAIAVDDDGPGIAPADRERIFAFGVRGTCARPGGSGVGLAVVRAIAERAGGSVSASQSATGGACFVLRLPCSPGLQRRDYMIAPGKRLDPHIGGELLHDK